MKTRELTKEEGDALTKDLQEVLIKHNCEIGVVSSIQLLKRVDEVISDNPEVNTLLNKNGDESNTNEETPKID